MDVKDVPNTKDLATKPNSSPAQALQKSLRALASSTGLELSRREAVSLAVEARRSSQGSEVRARANDAINVVNVASEATSEIEKLVDSIGGIVEQASSPHISESRRKILEKEANQLVDEIRRKAQVKTSDGVRPLAGDKFSVATDVASKKPVDIKLPDGAKDAFGIGEITFSPDDAIPQARSTLARAKGEIEKLKDSVKATQDQVKSTVDAIEVALQNSESAQTSIRDVDEALRLAGNTKIGIARNPSDALSSVGNLQKKALDLLE